MITVKDLPTGEGTQFVAVWTHNGQLWCDTYLIKDGAYLVYNGERDDFIQACPVWESGLRDIKDSLYYIIG